MSEEFQAGGDECFSKLHTLPVTCLTTLTNLAIVAYTIRFHHEKGCQHVGPKNRSFSSQSIIMCNVRGIPCTVFTEHAHH